ncbi:MAG: CBS domain-containing protein [Candidatus Methanoperedens sp.]|nr:CBS domain-containing protein [Candidatus Methanoperedens sp.]MCE8428129.1 CBS domain-containing protein [Candidatus Methanoperedens sp.]
MEVRMPVKEVMTSDVVTADIRSDVTQLAGKMLELDVGSIIITDGKRPVGIVTERDIVRKIVSKNRKPSDVSIKELMTTPLITIPASEDITDAMHRMVKMQIRRLPVVENSNLIGIVTDIDLIAVSVEMGNIFSDLIKMNRETILTTESPQKIHRGICEECGDNVDTLLLVDGKLLCESCQET